MNMIRDSFSKNKYGTLKYRTTDRKEPAWDLMGVVDDVVSVERYFVNDCFGRIEATEWFDFKLRDYSINKVLSNTQYGESVGSEVGKDVWNIERGDLLEYLQDNYPEVVGAYEEIIAVSPDVDSSYYQFAERVGWKCKEGLMGGFIGPFENNQIIDLTTNKKEHITVFDDLEGIDLTFAVLTNMYEVGAALHGVDMTEIHFKDGSTFAFFIETQDYKSTVEIDKTTSDAPNYSSAKGVMDFVDTSNKNSMIESLMEKLQDIGE